jgi:hypothetical protein
MLRRNFIKAATIALGGVLFINRLPSGMDETPEDTTKLSGAPRSYHFHGHPRSGCATRPELAAMLGKGFSVIPPA